MRATTIAPSLTREQYQKRYYKENRAEILAKRKAEYRKHIVETMDARIQMQEELSRQRRIDADKNAHQFALLLRRSLYLNVIQMQTADWLKSMSFVPPQFKTAAQNINNACNRFNMLMLNAQPEVYKVVRAELTSDQVNNIAELIDACVDVRNLEEVIEIIKSSKVAAHEKGESKRLEGVEK